MNENIGYLNLFFRQAKESATFTLPEFIADHIPSLIFVYNAGSGKIYYSNQRLIEFAGRDFTGMEVSGDSLESIIHPEDISTFASLISALTLFRENEQNAETIRFADPNGTISFTT